MKKINENIKNRRRALGMTQEDLAKEMGYKSRSTIAKIEAGENDVSHGKIMAFAEALNTTPAMLMGIEIDPTEPQYVDVADNHFGLQMQAVPLVGNIAAGSPILAMENIEDAYGLDASLGADFCLKIKGDSMIEEGIFDGDIVFIHQQPEVNNGDIAAVIIENEATLKRFYKQKDAVVLQPANKLYEPIVLREGDVHVAGKLVAVLSVRK